MEIKKRTQQYADLVNNGELENISLFDIKNDSPLNVIIRTEKGVYGCSLRIDFFEEKKK